MHRPSPASLAAALVAAVLAALAARPLAADENPAPPAKVEKGYIHGAEFAIASPPGGWNRDVLLIAHGYRPDTAPLIADLHPERAALQAILGDGWIVATTSFRRNGLIVDDAIADLDALRAYIANAYGEPDRVILEGDSLGGLIVTIMAERDRGPYQGAVVFDAALYTKESNMKSGLSLLPRIPLLFVATEREVAPAESYLTSLIARPDPVVQPELFLISREGHMNVNQAEHLLAFRALNAWIERGRDALPAPAENARYFDATVPADPGPSVAMKHPHGRGFDCQVLQVDAVYGNILLDAQAQDFADAGIAPMTYFELKAGANVYRARYARTFTDVKQGDWVAFPDAEGQTVLARSYADAAATAGLKVGDPVTFTVLDPHGNPLP
jgi:pimeloyl-ACP methyl ester carboxylesterase